MYIILCSPDSICKLYVTEPDQDVFRQCLHSGRVQCMWRRLSKQKQDLRKAMGYTYGGQSVLYFILQLVGTFGFISQMQQAKPLTTAGFLSTALIFSWLTYVFCNATDRATKFLRKSRVLPFSFCARERCCGGQICLSFREAEVTIRQLRLYN